MVRRDEAPKIEHLNRVGLLLDERLDQIQGTLPGASAFLDHGQAQGQACLVRLAGLQCLQPVRGHDRIAPLLVDEGQRNRRIQLLSRIVTGRGRGAFCQARRLCGLALLAQQLRRPQTRLEKQRRGLGHCDQDRQRLVALI